MMQQKIQLNKIPLMNKNLPKLTITTAVLITINYLCHLLKKISKGKNLQKKNRADPAIRQQCSLKYYESYESLVHLGVC